MREWIWERDCLRTYKETRNGLLGSITLRNYPLAGQWMPLRGDDHWEIKRFEEERGANESTYWLFFELFCASFSASWPDLMVQKFFFRGDPAGESAGDGVTPNPGKWKLVGLRMISSMPT